MHISEEGLVSGSVIRAELVAAYNEATDEAVRANLAAAGAEHGLVVDGGRMVDPSAEPEPEPEPENESEAAGEELSDEPPRSGPGSGKEAWVAYAENVGVEVTDDMTRDDIIAAVDEANEE